MFKNRAKLYLRGNWFEDALDSLGVKHRHDDCWLYLAISSNLYVSQLRGQTMKKRKRGDYW